MSQTLLGKTKNGHEVFVDMEHSHAATHLKKYPILLEYAKDIIAEVTIDSDYERFDRDMGKIVGESDLVSTTDGDDIVYAKRPNRSLYTRFVKDRIPEPTTWVTLSLKKAEEDAYELSTIYIGRAVPPFPDPQRGSAASKKFWAAHALVWGRQEVVPGTETEKCPW